MDTLLSILAGGGDGPRGLEEVTVRWGSPSEICAGGRAAHTCPSRPCLIIPVCPASPVLMSVVASVVTFQRGPLAK